MIELTVLDYLRNKMSVPVGLEKPVATECVVIEKTGSGEFDHIKNATFAIQSYSDSLYNAVKLNEEVKQAMLGDDVMSEGIAELNEIGSCSLNSDYNYTDTTTKQYRYQAVFDITHY